MRVFIMKTAEEASKTAADVMEKAVRAKPELVIGLATGSTPLGLYNEMIRRCKEDGLDFSRASSFNLDEYFGVRPDHPCSYRRFMNENLFDHINIDKARTHVPDGMAADIEAHCRLYDKMIHDAGNVDVQVLGIGSDGHIGFNEPTCSLASRTHRIYLTEQTRRDNARFFDKLDDVPTQAITMGIGTILESRTCLMLAFGANKADAVAGMIEGPVTAMNPASALQYHNDTVVFIDEAAASKLKLRGYYDAAAAAAL